MSTEDPSRDTTAQAKEPGRHQTDIGRQAVAGVFWVGAGQFVRMGVSFLTTIFLTRLLQPSELGIFALAYVVAELAQILTAFGIGAAIIQQQVTQERTLHSCFWLNVLIGLGVAIVLCAGAPLVALFYSEPAIAGLTWALAVNVLVCTALVVPQALLTQRLAFAAQAKAQVLGSLCSAVVAVASAWAGAGVWTLAIQPLVGNTVTALLMSRYAAWMPRLHFAFDDVRPLMRFSSHLLVGGWLDWLSRSLPNLFLGKLIGTAAVGIYGTAAGLTGTVVFQITSVISRVLFPTIALLRNDPERLQSAWLKASSGIAMVTWPVLGCAATVATDLVPSVYGGQWSAAVVPFQLLAVMMMVQAVGFTASSVIVGLGRPDIMNAMAVLGIGAAALALAVGSMFGLDEAVAAYAGVRVALLLWAFHAACKLACVPRTTLLQALRPWAQATLVACVGTHLCNLSTDALPVWLRLALTLVTGGVVYAAALFVCDRPQAASLIQDVWSRIRKRAH